jgi:hypothetical protein
VGRYEGHEEREAGRKKRKREVFRETRPPHRAKSGPWGPGSIPHPVTSTTGVSGPRPASATLGAVASRGIEQGSAFPPHHANTGRAGGPGFGATFFRHE